MSHDEHTFTTPSRSAEPKDSSSASVVLPPCTISCPAMLPIQDILSLAAQNKFVEAFRRIESVLPLPGAIARICNHPCETACNRKTIDEPISIGQIHRFVADYVYENPELLDELERQTKKNQGNTKQVYDQKVAIIGAGPAGLTAAYDLSQMGYKITVFESEKYCGGMLRYGVPDFRLPRTYLQREIEHLCKRVNIEIKNGQKFGKDFNIKDLKSQGFKAIFLAVGMQKSNDIHLDCYPGLENRIFYGIEYLEQLNREMIAPDFFKGKHIAVIGSGNIAIDSARTVRRLGGHVTIIYPQLFEELSAQREEIHQAQEEDIAFSSSTEPVRFTKKEKETWLTCVKVKFEASDEFEQKQRVILPNSEFCINCDYVICAVDREIDRAPLINNDIELSASGCIKVNPFTLQTSQPDIFAGGDAVVGPASGIQAIMQGHQAAVSIDCFLHNNNIATKQEKNHYKVGGTPKVTTHHFLKREQTKILSVPERISSFQEVNQGFTKEQTVYEAKRCLQCTLIK